MRPNNYIWGLLHNNMNKLLSITPATLHVFIAANRSLKPHPPAPTRTLFSMPNEKWSFAQLCNTCADPPRRQNLQGHDSAPPPPCINYVL